MRKIISFLVLFMIFVPFNAKALSCLEINGLSIFGYNGSEYEFIGSITNKYDSDSIANKYGSYGGKYSSKSMFNEYGHYGGKYGSSSAFNNYTSKSPVMIDSDLNFVGYISTNEYKTDAVHPVIARSCAENSFSSTIRNHEDITFKSLSKLGSGSGSYYSDDSYYELLEEMLKEYEGNDIVCPSNSSEGEDGQCYCNNGYKVNSNKDSCIKIECTSHSKLINNICVCDEGYMKNGYLCITYDKNCKKIYGNNSYGDKNNCYCNDDYEWNNDKTKCVEVVEEVINNSEFDNEDVDSQNDDNQSGPLTERLKGKLLLQVNQGGRIWYVNPDNAKRFEITFANALPLFENFALGISDNDLEDIPLHEDSWTSAVGNRLKGKLLLQVNQGGRIWYVDFDGKRWEVTWDNLMTLFESLSLGIADSDLFKIGEGEL